MLVIKKGREPKELAEHRATAGADYAGMPKEGVRTQLVSEQKGLCAYCMRRIENNHSTKIEHFLCQTKHRDKSLTYTNMFAVCNKETNICENAKGSTDFKKLNLYSSDIIALIKYRKNGEIYSENEKLENDITNVLKLNDSFYLKSGRKAVYEKFSEKILQMNRDEKCSVSSLHNYKKKLLELNNGNHIEYLGVYLYFLEKKIETNNKMKNPLCVKLSLLLFRIVSRRAYEEEFNLYDVCSYYVYLSN